MPRKPQHRRTTLVKERASRRRLTWKKTVLPAQRAGGPLLRNWKEASGICRQNRSRQGGFPTLIEDQPRGPWEALQMQRKLVRASLARAYQFPAPRKRSSPRLVSGPPALTAYRRQEFPRTLSRIDNVPYQVLAINLCVPDCHAYFPPLEGFNGKAVVHQY